MNNSERLSSFIKKILFPHSSRQGRLPRKTSFHIDKRQKFVIAVLVLGTLLFFTGRKFGITEIAVSFGLAIVTDIFLLWSTYQEIKENFSFSVFVLPFFFTLAFSLFYFLVPSRLLFRSFITLIYAVGLYSVYLSQNVFIVAAIRTIALLSGARIVSFIITLLSFFFLSNIVFTLHLPLYLTEILLAIYTYPLFYQSMWTYTLQKTPERLSLWVLFLTLTILEASAIIWFWPSSPTVMALFLTGLFYTIGGLSHVWFERRLFKGVLWEYVWISAVVFFVLVSFTSWGK